MAEGEETPYRLTQASMETMAVPCVPIQSQGKYNEEDSDSGTDYEEEKESPPVNLIGEVAAFKADQEADGPPMNPMGEVMAHVADQEDRGPPMNPMGEVVAFMADQRELRNRMKQMMGTMAVLIEIIKALLELVRTPFRMDQLGQDRIKSTQLRQDKIKSTQMGQDRTKSTQLGQNRLESHKLEQNRTDQTQSGRSRTGQNQLEQLNAELPTLNRRGQAGLGVELSLFGLRKPIHLGWNHCLGP